MFNAEIRQMLVEVIRSWQVIAVTIFIIFYIFIINKVAKISTVARQRPPKKRRSKKEKADVPAPSADDDLGLEEEGAEDSKEPDEVYVE